MIMSNPKIRFMDFTDAWEQRKVSEVAEIVAGGTPSTKIRNYWEPKEVPWLSSGEVHKKYITFTDNMISQEGMNNSSAKMIKENSVLIALAGQGKTRGTVAINRIPLTTNQSIAAMTFNDDIVPEFIFCNLENRYDEIRKMSSGDGARGGLNKQLVGDIEIPYTSYEEQKKIGTYFEQLDNLITLHQRKCDETKELKKYMLQKMFPKNGEKKPEIRFAGFNDNWEQRKFGDMFERRMERNGGQFDNTRWISVAKMYFQEPDKVTSNNIDTRTYVMRKGDIAFEGHPNSDFKYGRFVENDIGDGVISELFPIYRHIDDYDLNYWKYAIQLESIMQKIFVQCIEISYTSSNKLDEQLFLKESILVPTIEEQNIIGEYFKELDNLITLHQRKCDDFKELKRYMLQNMFPTKG